MSDVLSLMLWLFEYLQIKQAILQAIQGTWRLLNFRSHHHLIDHWLLLLSAARPFSAPVGPSGATKYAI